MIKSRANEVLSTPSPEYMLVSAALAQILYEGQVFSIDVDLPASGVSGRIEASISLKGVPELRVLVD